MKDLWVEEHKPWNQEARPATIQRSKEAAQKVKKEKKKDCNNRGHEQRAKGSTPAFGVNTVDSYNRSSKNQNADQPKKDSSQVTYWNYD